jgi:hypothetical protein
MRPPSRTSRPAASSPVRGADRRLLSRPYLLAGRDGGGRRHERAVMDSRGAGSRLRRSRAPGPNVQAPFALAPATLIQEHAAVTPR